MVEKVIVGDVLWREFKPIKVYSQNYSNRPIKRLKYIVAINFDVPENLNFNLKKCGEKLNDEVGRILDFTMHDEDTLELKLDLGFEYDKVEEKPKKGLFKLFKEYFWDDRNEGVN